MGRTRKEFSRKTKVAAWERSGGHCEAIADGERCNVKLLVGKFRYDHILPDQLGGEPTLENCQVICMACDGQKTPQDQADIAKAKRVASYHITGRSRERKGRGFRGHRKFDGTPVWNEER